MKRTTPESGLRLIGCSDDLVFKAATESTKRLRYIVGSDAGMMYAEQVAMPEEADQEWAVSHFNSRTSKFDNVENRDPLN
ncbi:hypothetical protein SAMN06265222_10716 [Neorhodopirellula lusitana]|uniref:Uncharacterized protein n=1 Tax=Neorhodopirellula lusitana TaxID=445327 RepID=A0ABY1Q6Z2_9BACT|nr:hypothetical protein [Neorhodopirellula lusitana]SMP60913.1 hypothetical protein SAMN06265222_10716 [Neorhodopirellula lusitana]